MDFRIGDIVRFTTDRCYHSTREWPILDPMPEPHTPGIVIRVAPCYIVTGKNLQTVWVSYPTPAAPDRNLCTDSGMLELVFPFIPDDIAQTMRDRLAESRPDPELNKRTLKRKIRVFFLGG